ncbi:MAG: flagellin FljL [Acetobacteraceae bacterium]
MPLNSVNTNIAAQVALQSLNTTTTQLQETQKRISTGYRVADATDDGSAFAVAQRVRADVGALTTVNSQLGNAKGLVGTTLSALTSISNSITEAKSLLINIGSQDISQTQRDQYVASYKTLVERVANTVDGSTYNGQTLLGAASGNVAGAPVSVFNNENGATSTLSAENSSSLANTLATLIGSTFSRTAAGVDSFGAIAAGADQSSAALALTATAGATAFTTVQTTVANQLNQAGADSKFLDATITQNSSKIDSLNAGLGALVDADLSKESAKLQALQIRQQLGTQALSLANQSPQSLLSLFK